MCLHDMANANRLRIKLTFLGMSQHFRIEEDLDKNC